MKEVKKEKTLFSLGNINLSIRTRDSFTHERIKTVYKEHLTQNHPNIQVDFRYIRKVPKGRFLVPFSPGSDWFYGVKGKDLLIYFPLLPRGKKATLIKTDNRLCNITVLSESKNSTLSLFHIPVILLSLYLSKCNGLIMHASGILNKKGGYLFVAPSEGGKSTIARLALHQGMSVLSDETIIIRHECKRVTMYGTPWHGEIAVKENVSVPLKKLFFIVKSKRNEIRPISKSNAMLRLLRNCFYFPLTEYITKNYINSCCKIAENVDCYELRFRPTKNLWRFLNAHS